MDKNKKIALVCAYLLYLKKKPRKQSIWHKSWLGDHQRLVNSFVFNLEPLIFSSTSEDTRNYIRLAPDIYEEIIMIILNACKDIEIDN